MKRKLLIEGMSCMHCVMHVQNALKEINGVSDVNVDLKGKNAVVEINDNVSDEQLKSAVADVGYDVVEIKNI